MSYSTVEAGLMAVIVLLDGWQSTGTRKNISQGDYRILGRGHSKVVILQPGSFGTRNVAAAPRRMRTPWTILIELYIPYRGDISDIATQLRTIRQEIIDHVDKYPTLNGIAGVVHAQIASGQEPAMWQGQDRNWWRQVILCNVEERATVTIAE